MREAIEINDRLRSEVKRKIARSSEFLAELEGKARRYRELLQEIGHGGDHPDPVVTSTSSRPPSGRTFVE